MEQALFPEKVVDNIIHMYVCVFVRALKCDGIYVCICFCVYLPTVKCL